MPVGYVFSVSLITWCTALAVVPLRRPRTLGLVTWGSSLVLNELPFVAFYLLLASTLLAFGEGDIDSLGGWVAVGLALLATVGLVIIVRRALRTGPAVDRALSEALGAGWRTGIDAGAAARLRRRLPWASILFGPWLVRRRDVERIADISYGDAGKGNLLDVYRHRSHPPAGPVLIYLHGGRFARGGKNREARPLLYRLASQGWVCVSANYRLSATPAAGFPGHLIDVKMVIAWVRAHGHDYGADPTAVFVSGSSAGAHLTAMAALTPNDPVFQPDFESVDTSITAAVCLYGYFGQLGGEESIPSSPLAYARTDAPPFFVAHGDNDTYTPVAGARDLVDHLRSTSSHPVVYAELPGAQHSFDLFHSIRFESVVDGIEAFATWVRSHEEVRVPSRPEDDAATRWS